MPADIEKAGAAYRCDFCGDWPNWQMLRVGDAAITWACDAHTAWTLDRFQRVGEQTKVIVTRCMHRADYEGQLRPAGGEGD